MIPWPFCLDNKIVTRCSGIFAVYLALNLLYIPLLESFQTHELLVYQLAATEVLIVLQKLAREKPVSTGKPECRVKFSESGKNLEWDV